jgi:hypothetical protein
MPDGIALGVGIVAGTMVGVAHGMTLGILTTITDLPVSMIVQTQEIVTMVQGRLVSTEEVLMAAEMEDQA